jgi:hypothetical protein
VNIAEKEILIAENEVLINENISKVFKSGENVGYENGYQQGYGEGEEIGFTDGWLDNETTVVSELREPVQKVENYVEDGCGAQDSVGMIRYIDEKLPKVYDAGKQDEQKRFWDAFMDSVNGNPYSAKYVFAGPGWTDDTFNPNKDCRPFNVDGFFFQCHINDLKGILERNGVTFDFSRVTGTANSFAYYSKITKFPTINFSSLSRLASSFAGLTGENVSLPLILSDSGNQTFTSTFNNSTGLTNLTIVSGVIGNDFDVHWSPLTKASIESIVNHLSDTASGKTLTLNKTVVNTVFGIDVDDESTFPIGSDFYNLRHSKDNWAFNYLDV